jgi:hypothetical protein
LLALALLLLLLLLLLILSFILQNGKFKQMVVFFPSFYYGDSNTSWERDFFLINFLIIQSDNPDFFFFLINFFSFTLVC